ncbi:MAG: DNA cytosine methyltransferase [Undibacterium sp.]|nr:DNA cytosine methyltransferase [Opitutaceae bacterium]
MNELALFAGAGGGILGGKLLGWRTVCAVEIDDYARRVLMARQDDGSLPPFPIWDDIRTFDGKPWRGVVDIITGGFPCQDISVAGTGKGLDGARSGLWTKMARTICEVGPRYVLVENSPALTARGLGRVLGDLAALGYDARWGVLGAVDAGGPHRRERIWIVAHAQLPERWPLGGACHGLARSDGLPQRQESAGRIGGCGEALAHADSLRELQPSGHHAEGWRRPCDGGWWAAEPDVGRMAHGVASRVDRLRCLGNGQVPAVVALAWTILTENQFKPFLNERTI